jgi:Tol biopolymer transport system component
MYRLLLSVPVMALALAALPGQQPAGSKLLIAISSYRDRPRHPNIYLYEHDGVGTGKVIGVVGGMPNRSAADSYSHPSLTADGRYCAYTYEKENETGRILLWDIKEQKQVELPAINDNPNAQMGAAISGDGKLMAFAGWNRPKAPSARWHVFLYDLPVKKLLDLPGLNVQDYDQRMPALSGDGRFLAYATNAKGTVGLTDVYLFDRKDNKVLPLPEMNSKNMDAEPSLSADGNLVAFVSDRPGGAGGRDIYLFDRATGKFLELPGLNSTSHEQSPCLSADGRLIVFVSERLGGEGDRDVYLYDRQAQKLLPTPGLNSKAEDYDPCVVVLKSEP